MSTWKSMRERSRGLLLASALIAVPWASLASGGSVLSATGDVQAVAGEEVRALVAGDAIAAGEEIRAADGAGAALAVGDLWVEIGAASSVRLDEDGAVAITRGTARVVDLGAAGATLRTPHAEVEVAGSDTEILVEQDRSEMCERRRAVRVAPLANADGRTQTPVGQCCSVSGEGVVSLAAAGAERLALSGARVDVAVASHFTPTDVAAPTPSLDLFPLDPDKRTYLPCDNPSSCGGALTVQPAPAPRTPPPRRVTPSRRGFGTGPGDEPGNDYEPGSELE